MQVQHAINDMEFSRGHDAEQVPHWCLPQKQTWRQVASLQTIPGKKNQGLGAQLRSLLQESLSQLPIPRMGSRGIYPSDYIFTDESLFQEDQASLPFLGASTLKKALRQRVFRNLPEICTPQKCSVHLRLEVGHEYVRKSAGSACREGSIRVSRCYQIK